MRDAGLERAIAAAGGISALARAVGVAQPSVSNWSRIPAERVLAVEAVTAISRSELRPDLYPADPSDAIDEIDLARGKMYLLLANVLREPPTSLTLAELAGFAEAGGGAIGDCLSVLGRAAIGLDEERAARDHFALFVGVGRAELVPYASYYRTGFLYERPLVNIREDMRVLGIVRGNDSNEPEDSIGFLCEAMAGMALKRFEAGEEFERRFFTRHIANWAEGFFADLEKTEISPFYVAVGRLGRVFIGLEREGFAIEAENNSEGRTGRANEPEGHHERQAS